MCCSVTLKYLLALTCPGSISAKCVQTSAELTEEGSFVYNMEEQLCEQL